MVGADEPLRVGDAGGLVEGEVVDHVAAEGGQRDALAGLDGGAAWLGVLPRHAPDLDDGHGRAVGQHRGHLQDRLDPVADVVGGGGREGLGAVAALEHEGLADGGLGHPVGEDVALAGEDERRIRSEGLDHLGQGSRVGPGRLLLGLELGGRGREGSEGLGPVIGFEAGIGGDGPRVHPVSVDVAVGRPARVRIPKPLLPGRSRARSPTTYAVWRGHGSGRVGEVEATLHRETHELHAVVHLQLAEDVLDVVLHGAVREEERRRDLLVAHAGRDVLEDLGLAVGELGNRSRRSRRRRQP